MLIWLRQSVLLAGLLAVAGCAPPSRDLFYAVTPDDVFARLLKADIVGFRDARQCGMLIYFARIEDEANRTVGWTVTSGDITLARFSLVVVPNQGGSVVDVQIPKAPDGHEIYDSTQKYSHPAILQPLRPALRELVDAAIEQRPYDWHRITELGPDYTICSSMRDNFIASGTPYSIDDPSGLTHDQAQAVRGRGGRLEVERDKIFAENGP